MSWSSSFSLIFPLSFACINKIASWFHCHSLHIRHVAPDSYHFNYYHRRHIIFIIIRISLIRDSIAITFMLKILNSIPMITIMLNVFKVLIYRHQHCHKHFFYTICMTLMSIILSNIVISKSTSIFSIISTLSCHCHAQKSTNVQKALQCAGTIKNALIRREDSYAGQLHRCMFFFCFLSSPSSHFFESLLFPYSFLCSISSSLL